LCPQQQSAELRAKPVRVERGGPRIGDPYHVALHCEVGSVVGCKQFWASREKAIWVYKKRTIRRSLPMAWPQEVAWNQVVRLIVQAAVEERSGKFISPLAVLGKARELLNPRHPSRVFYL